MKKRRNLSNLETPGYYSYYILLYINFAGCDQKYKLN